MRVIGDILLVTLAALAAAAKDDSPLPSKKQLRAAVSTKLTREFNARIDSGVVDRELGRSSKPTQRSKSSSKKSRKKSKGRRRKKSSLWDRYYDAVLPVSSGRRLSKRRGPQRRALKWLVRKDGGRPDVRDAERVRQRFLLATIYFSTGGHRGAWKSRLNFLSELHECQWNEDADFGGGSLGVACDGGGQVTDIRIWENGLSGEIPPEIGYLPLTYLALQHNALTGRLPRTIGLLEGLTDLLLQQNELRGRLPPSMGNLTHLQELFLEDNNFRGKIPKEMRNMRSLRNVWLSKNDFDGGMEVFCGAPDISLSLFYADCLGTSFPETPPQVECSCCTICCNEDEDCLPNN